MLEASPRRSVSLLLATALAAAACGQDPSSGSEMPGPTGSSGMSAAGGGAGGLTSGGSAGNSSGGAITPAGGAGAAGSAAGAAMGGKGRRFRRWRLVRLHRYDRDGHWRPSRAARERAARERAARRPGPSIRPIRRPSAARLAAKFRRLRELRVYRRRRLASGFTSEGTDPDVGARPMPKRGPAPSSNPSSAVRR